MLQKRPISREKLPAKVAVRHARTRSQLLDFAGFMPVFQESVTLWFRSSRQTARLYFWLTQPEASLVTVTG
jgi:hypothetical protein